MVLDDHNKNDLFMFRVDHRPNKPTSLASAFSDLALTELDDFLWCLEVPTNTDICFRSRMPRCRVDPRKNILSPILYRTYDWKGESTPPPPLPIVNCLQTQNFNHKWQSCSIFDHAAYWHASE
jgi:hypothetical protein